MSGQSMVRCKIISYHSAFNDYIITSVVIITIIAILSIVTY
jgi:hypothetical protein